MCSISTSLGSFAGTEIKNRLCCKRRREGRKEDRSAAEEAVLVRDQKDVDEINRQGKKMKISV